MTLDAYVDEIKLKLTGRVLELEISDDVIASIINASLRELQRYINSTKLITIPYRPCIDLSEYNPNSVSRVYRAEGYGVGKSMAGGSTNQDPMYMGMWQAMSGNGNLYNINDWTYNYAAWNSALQIRNTVSTDLLFRFDKSENKLYINCGFNSPEKITIEYIPVYNDVSEIKSDFWIDMLLKLSIAQVKVTLGRIRTRYTQTNALWAQDTSILQEGLDELADIREKLKQSTYLQFPVD